MNKDDVIEILDELFESVQDMREQGEGDLRTVLNLIDKATKKIELL